MPVDWAASYAKFQARAQELGVQVPTYLPGQKIDWSLVDQYRDMPVASRPKTAKIGGGSTRR